jgi:hypothetical protein
MSNYESLVNVLQREGEVTVKVSIHRDSFRKGINRELAKVNKTLLAFGIEAEKKVLEIASVEGEAGMLRVTYKATKQVQGFEII